MSGDDMTLQGAANLDSSQMLGEIGNIANALDRVAVAGKNAGNALASGMTQGTGRMGQVAEGLISDLMAGVGDFASVGKNLGQTLTMGMTNQFGMMGGVIGSAATAMGVAGLAAVGLAAGVGLVGSAAISAASDWEGMTTSISRTTGLKGDNLEDMMNQLQELRMNYGLTAQAAASMVDQAGSIGVGQMRLQAGDMEGYKEEILEFTESITMIQGAWGMAAEATAAGVGKMGSVTLNAWNMQRAARNEEAMSWGEYAQKVGGVIDTLANAMGSSEENIVIAMTNSSGAIAKWAPSEETYSKWQAFASFLIDTGDGASGAGTKIERLSQKMEQNADKVSKLMGMDTETLRGQLKTDFMGTVQDLGETLAAMPASERPDLFKLFDIEGAAAIGKVIADIEAGTGKLQGAFDMAANPGDVIEGYADVADNYATQANRVKSILAVGMEKLGGVMLPSVTAGVNGLATFASAALQAGQAISHLLSNSAAFQSMSSAASAMGGLLTTSFNNVAAVAGPLWESLGGGATAMGVLQVAFDAITFPLTAVATGISILANAANTLGTNISPIASLVGTTLGGAFQTGSAYVQAFSEAITDLVNNSVAINTIGGYFESARNTILYIIDGIKAAIDDLSKFITDKFGAAANIFGTVWKNLTGEQGLGGAADRAGMLDSGPLAWLGDIQERADEIRGIGQETGEEIAEGVKDSDLKTAPADAIKEGTDETKKAAADLGKNAADEFGNQFSAQMHFSGLSSLAMLDMINSQSTKANEQSLRQFEYMGQQFEMLISKGGSGYYTSLLQNGEVLGSKDFLGDYVKMDPLEAFEAITGLPAPAEGTAAYFRLMGDELSAMRLELQEELSGESGATFELKSIGLSIFSGEYEGGQELADNFDAALKNIDWAGLPGVVEAGNELKKGISDSMSSATAAAPALARVDEEMAKYQAALIAGVADASKMVESEMERMGSQSKDAFSDGFLSEGERGELLGLEPELQLLKATFPTEFEKAGGDSILAMVAAIKAGDLPGAMAAIGGEAAKGFTDSLTGSVLGSGETKSLAEILAGTGGEIADMEKFKENTFLPALDSSFETMYSKSKSGYEDDMKLAEAWVEDKQKLLSEHADYFENWQVRLIEMHDTGEVTTQEFLDVWHQMSEGAEEKASTAVEEYKSANALFYEEVRDNNKTWHDYINEEGGFVGPTVDWYQMKIDQRAQLEEIAAIKAEYEAMGGTSPASVGSIGMELDLITENADAEKGIFEDAIRDARPELTITATTQEAMDEVNRLITYIITVNPVMSVKVRVSAYPDEIRYMVEQAIRDAAT